MEAIPRERWDETLARHGAHDIYWSEAYVASAAVIEGGEPLLLRHSVVGATIFIGLVIRPTGEVVTPYGYGGPLVFSQARYSLERFWGAFGAWCRQNLISSAFIRSHPLFPARCPWAQPLAGTALIPTPAGRNLVAQMDPRHRNKVRCAQRSGAAVHIRAAPASLESFSHLYEETMVRLAAKSFYRFPPNYWTALARLRHSLLLAEVWRGGRLVAASLNMKGHEWVHYHLSAGCRKQSTLGSGQLMLWALAEWAQRNGLRGVHLGGGLGGAEDSLLDFKRRFAPAEPLRPFWVAHINAPEARESALQGCR